jgi:hypothetical protein
MSADEAYNIIRRRQQQQHQQQKQQQQQQQKQKQQQKQQQQKQQQQKGQKAQPSSTVETHAPGHEEGNFRRFKKAQVGLSRIKKV